MEETGAREASTPAAAAATSSAEASMAVTTTEGKPPVNDTDDKMMSLLSKIQNAINRFDDHSKNHVKGFNVGSSKSNIGLDDAREAVCRTHRRAALTVKEALSSPLFGSQSQPPTGLSCAPICTQQSKHKQSPFQPLEWETPSFAADHSSHLEGKKRSLGEVSPEQNENTPRNNARSDSQSSASTDGSSLADDPWEISSWGGACVFGMGHYPRKQFSEESKRKLLAIANKWIPTDATKRRKMFHGDDSKK